MLEGVLDQIDLMMQSEATQRIGDLIGRRTRHPALQHLRQRNIFQRPGRGTWTSDKLVKRISSVISEVNEDPHHELRKQFDEQLLALVAKPG